MDPFHKAKITFIGVIHNVEELDFMYHKIDKIFGQPKISLTYTGCNIKVRFAIEIHPVTNCNELVCDCEAIGLRFTVQISGGTNVTF
jgi:hypothetical protein